MKKIKIYLDCCSYNRPFDEQIQEIVRLETRAKLSIQQDIRNGIYTLVWSFILSSENDDNPSEEKRKSIALWKFVAEEYCAATKHILIKAKDFVDMGIKYKDALHLSCAVAHKCDYLITTDKKFTNKNPLIKGIEIVNPLTFIIQMEG